MGITPSMKHCSCAGKMLVAYVRDFKKVSENFMKINIGIYLVDF